MNINPYAPPSRETCDYVVRNSRTTMSEFARLADQPVMGRLVWVLMKMRLVNLDLTVVPGPKPLVDEICSRDELSPHVRQMIENVLSDASTSGFATQFWSGWQSAGSKISCGAVRLLHQHQKCFLQVIASGDGTHGWSETHVVSFAVSGPDSDCSFTTSNSHKKYNLPLFAIANYLRGATIPELLEYHNVRYADRFSQFKSISCFDDIAFVIDSNAVRFAEYMVKRGLWVRHR